MLTQTDTTFVYVCASVPVYEHSYIYLYKSCVLVLSLPIEKQ